jgi:mannitol/fructose-specific phosphotransferase system IIA component (Ntr-type)
LILNILLTNKCNKKCSYCGFSYQKVINVLDEKFIFENVEGNTIEDVIHSIIAKVSGCDKVINSCKTIIEDAVIKREHEIPTAIGKGIAIPHARVDEYNDVSVIIAKLKNPNPAAMPIPAETHIPVAVVNPINF